MDIDLLIRLRATARAVLEEDQKQSLGQAQAVVDIYAQIRGRLFEAVPDELHDELTGLMPADLEADLTGTAHIKIAAATRALTTLRAIAGWLDGVIESATRAERLSAEAEAYAKERVRAEQTAGLLSRRPNP